ncbi:hypothetical protein CQ010_01510 [Arthrobacter sp. MYb211]|uniref:hypothetical protein n=1 Tax=unclassified Arthrobacter TaxID=235627 RepID=UPI000CFB6AD2|nr:MULTISPECIES: hypothetical protein [unclassified Arthrobacter]PRA13351.1 hypothetical protein CQ015_03765 [Arthrobacter sp. MYb221]PRC10548.1 hypothetical protein CQ010_01510 [Arthrobacter sp. MYb211]
MSKNFPHGIDITAPGGIEALMAHHYKTFRDAQMNANAGDAGDGGDGGDGGAAGGDAGDSAGTAAGTTAAGAAGDGQGAAGSAGDAGAGAQTNPWGEDFNAEKAWNLVQGLRSDKDKLTKGRDTAITEAVTKAVEDTKTSFTQDIAKALGLVEDTPDPAKLLEQVTGERDNLTGERDQWKDTATDALRRLGVSNAAQTHNATASKLLDSMSFMEQVKKFDPAADDFASQVDAVVKSAVEADKSLRAQAAANRGGGDFSGGNNAGATQLTREQLAGMSPAEILKANKEGRLKSLSTPTGN